MLYMKNRHFLELPDTIDKYCYDKLFGKKSYCLEIDIGGEAWEIKY